MNVSFFFSYVKTITFRDYHVIHVDIIEIPTVFLKVPKSRYRRSYLASQHHPPDCLLILSGLISVRLDVFTTLGYLRRKRKQVSHIPTAGVSIVHDFNARQLDNTNTDQ